jgi:hypothetical protein
MSTFPRANPLRLAPPPYVASNLVAPLREAIDIHLDAQRREMLFVETLISRLEKSLDPHTRSLAAALTDCLANQRGQQSRFLAAYSRFDRSLGDRDTPAGR